MRKFRAIVFVLSRAVHHGRHRGAVRRGVAAELVRDKQAGLQAFSFQQLTEESGGYPPIAPEKRTVYIKLTVPEPPVPKLR